MEKAKIGLIGLAVMGANLARNIADKGHKIIVYNRTQETTDKFLESYKSETLFGADSLEEFVNSLETPRKIIVMVKAGKPVDELIEKLTPLLSQGDIIIDCGNSFYRDTQRRYRELKKQGFHFMGCGVSGGEEGALKGPSIMPGADREVYGAMKDILESIAAEDFTSGKCVTYVGADGAGHFVKMVHNGIEYAIMQMIAEAYDGLRKIYGLNAEEISVIFQKFNSGKLNSYLFEITSNVLAKKDEFNDSEYLVDNILDTAGAKGTGKWTSIEGLDRAESVSTIVEATFARALSSEKLLREKLSKLYVLESKGTSISLDTYIKVLENTLYIGMLFAYAQGYALIMKTSKEENWDINLSEISRIWEGGCIIRAEILDFLTKTFLKNKNFEHLFELDEIRNEIISGLGDYKTFISIALDNNISIPSLSTGMSYFQTVIQEKSSANLIQGLRDYFGAHTYERTDRDGIFHTHW